jgi:uncharacterized protein (UPF0276 family)
MPYLEIVKKPDSSNPFMVGVGLRHSHYKDALLGAPSIDFVEVHAENFFAKGGIIPELLSDISQKYPVSLHSTAMGLGSAAGINREYLLRLMRLSQQINPILISDHACFTWSTFNGNKLNVGDLLPIEFTQNSLDVMAENVDRVQQLLGRRILVENLSAYIEFDYSEMSETDFLTELTQKTGCGLLVDLNNLLVNAHNFSQEDVTNTAQEWLNNIPLDSVGEIHLAGYTPAKEGELIIDDHSQPVSDECWELYRHALQRIGPVVTLIEWDNALPSWDTLLDQAELARLIINNEFYSEGEIAHAI